MDNILTRTLKHLKKKRIFLYTGSISFASMFALVPMMAIFLLLLSHLGFSASHIKQFKLSLINHFFSGNYDPSINNYISSFIDNLQTLSPLLIFFWIVSCILLLYSIEDSINEIFNINRRRSLKISLLLHIALMLFLPLVLMASFLLNHYITHILTLKVCASFTAPICQLLYIIPFIIDVLMCLILYSVFPAQKPRLKPLFIASTITGILLYGAKYAVSTYFTYTSTYTTIYGTISSIPIIMTSLYVIWYIIFLGAALCYLLNQPKD